MKNDELGNPWLAILIGIAFLWFTWYINFKLGANPHLHGTAAIVNSSFGRKLLSVFSILTGVFFLFGGISKIRNRL